MEQNELEQTEGVENNIAEVSSQETQVKPFSEKTDKGYKIDFSKTTTHEKEQSLQDGSEEQQNEAEGNKDEQQDVLQEVIDSDQSLTTTTSAEKNEQTIVDAIKEADKKDLDLPENIYDLVRFMNDTGGTLEDYIRLNTDYSNVDEVALLTEYYKSKKKHLSNDEIQFLIEDKFSYDEDIDDDTEVKRKKLAFKEEVGYAREFLGELKEKYYKELKLGSKLPAEQKEAIEFYDRYKKEQEKTSSELQKNRDYFTKKTEELFNNEFKGFEFNVGDKKYRYNISDTNSVKNQQSDINNIFGKFLKNNVIDDAAGYHKALFAANNADAIARHFYEQGKTDATKKIMADSKNINMDNRKTSSGIIEVGGTKIRVINPSYENNKLKIKTKN